MKREVKRLNEKTDKRIQYQRHIDINKGGVVACNSGRQRHIEVRRMGDAVNVAARLEKHALAGQIVIGDKTYSFVKDRFSCRALGAEKLKGKEKEMHLYEVLGEK